MQRTRIIPKRRSPQFDQLCARNESPEPFEEDDGLAALMFGEVTTVRGQV